ncbi:MAG TPA: hypothetical protein VJH23_06355 [archaeon]|nr:hypothetical protein [archaeon]
MVFFEAITAALNLDAGFFIRIAMNNLLWVFIFATVNQVLFKGKDLFRNTALFSLYIWAFRDFLPLWGLEGFIAGPVIFFVFMALMQIFVLDPKVFGKHTALADVAGFYGIIFFINFFAR